jgi:large subunit ribosomal protein L7/L12
MAMEAVTKIRTLELTDRLSRSAITLVISGFQSLPVACAEELRLKLHGRGTLLAAKNRVAMIAAFNAGVDLGELTGQTALVFLQVDLPEALRDLLAFAKNHPMMKVLRGWRDGGTVDMDELDELASLAEPIESDEPEMVEEQQTMFDVVLLAAGAKKIQVIKAIRELTGLGLKDAKDAAESAPFLLLEHVGQEAAQSALARLTAEGAEAELR